MASLKDLYEKLGEILEARASKRGKWELITIAKGDTVSAAIDIGGHFAFLQVIIPTIDTAQLELQGSDSIAGTYQDLGQDALTIASTGVYSDTWILGGWRYIKIKASAAQDTAVVQFKVRGITY